MNAPISANLLSVLEQIRAIALEGLHFAKHPYDRARYQRLYDLGVQSYIADVGLADHDVRAWFAKETGIVTPKLGADAAVIDDEGRVLVLHRADDGLWCLPCGWVDIGEAPSQAAIREVKEETGLHVVWDRYVNILHKGPQTHARFHHQVAVLSLMKPLPSGVPIMLSHEHKAYRWVDQNDHVDWHPGHDAQYKALQVALSGIHAHG